MSQLKDFIKQINDEIYYLDQKEEIELSRDWSQPNKLDSSMLKQYKKNLDYELERRLKININPLKVLGQALIDEKHPASNHIKVNFRSTKNRKMLINFLFKIDLYGNFE